MPTPDVSLPLHGIGWLGHRAIYACSYIVDLVLFCADALAVWRKPRNIWNRATYSTFIAQVIFSGVDAIPVATLLALALGVGIATHLIQLVASLGDVHDVVGMLAQLVALELGPLMTAIILVGRSGSAIVVDLGAMKISRQIDGLAVLGVDVRDVFVIPRLIAIVIAQLALALWISLVILLTGIISSALFYGLPSTLFLSRLVDAFALGDTLLFVVKNGLFGLMIGAAACFHGLRPGNDSTELVRQTQRSIINCIALVIVTDAILMAVAR